MKEEKNKSVFEVLNAINCNEHTEKKNGLTYLSWAWAWGIVKKNFPDAIYTIYEDEQGRIYHNDGKTAWVKTGVTINGIECIEYLPVMDFRNQSIPLERITSFDANKAIQRSLTKACARHGLGLYIYAGEDLPETQQDFVDEKASKEQNDLIAQVMNCNTSEEINKIWLANKELQSDKAFASAVKTKCNELRSKKASK